MSAVFRIGTAAWNIPKLAASEFPDEGTHLERYAQRLTGVEINSSFYRPHKPATYQRWAASVPKDFRFAVKMPREITHKRKLTGVNEPLDRFLGEISELGKKLGPVLVQLPPSLRYDPKLTPGFFKDLRARFEGDIVCEPRHPTWFTPTVDAYLKKMHVARVAADPAVVAEAREPGGYLAVSYRRLHGSPKIYYSSYSASQIAKTERDMAHATAVRESWCIFDNTALGEATINALQLDRLIRPSRG